MSQVTDRTIGANPTGFDMRTELNNIISALESDNSGSSEPLNTVAGMKWMDTSNATYYYVKERNHDNTAWVTLFRYTVATKIMEAVSNGVVLSQTDIASEIHASSSKTTPVDSDEIGLIDSASTFTLKKLTWDNIKATLKTYFDTLYVALSGNQTIAGIKTFSSSPIAPTPTAGDNSTKMATTAFVQGEGFLKNKALLAEYIVSGSAVTSIDFSGLDINTHKSYVVEAEILNSIGTQFQLLMHINGDTTSTNYYSQEVNASGSSIATTRVNSPEVTVVSPSNVSNFLAVIQRVNGYPKWLSTGSRNSGSGVDNLSDFGSKTATVTNITQLTFTSTVASSIGVGSKIRIYRGDV